MLTKISSSPRNRLAQNFLRNWYHYDTDVDMLHPLEETNMKILYASVRNLSEYELQFLAEKYRTPDGLIRDSVLADRYSMTHKDYKEERIRIEDKLQIEIVKNCSIYKGEGGDKQWS